MSLDTDSPVHSSSSEDFVTFLDAALDATSPDASSLEEHENQDDFESTRFCLHYKDICILLSLPPLLLLWAKLFKNLLFCKACFPRAMFG